MCPTKPTHSPPNGPVCVPPADIQLLVNEHVDGEALMGMTAELLKHSGLKMGSASRILRHLGVLRSAQ